MPSGEDAGCDRSRVLTWFASRWRNHQPKRAEKPHSIIRCRKAPDGPATRPMTPLAVENGVGKPAAPLWRERLMSARERERGALPPPNLSLSDRKVGQGHFFARAAFQTPLFAPGKFAKRRLGRRSPQARHEQLGKWNDFRSGQPRARRGRKKGFLSAVSRTGTVELSFFESPPRTEAKCKRRQQ